MVVPELCLLAVMTVPAAAGVSARAVSWNVAALSMDGPGVLTTLRALDADVVALQEVDDGTRRSGGVTQAAWLAGKLGMHAAFGPAMDFDGGRYGIALLSRAPLTGVSTHPLPRLRAEEPRVALTATTTIRGVPVTVVNTHLCANWRATEPDLIRAAQAGHLARLLETLPTTSPLLLLGDFNWTLHELQPHLARAVRPATDRFPPTHPAAAPTRALDMVWLRAGAASDVKVTRLEAPGTLASDHRPVVMDFQFTAP